MAWIVATACLTTSLVFAAFAVVISKREQAIRKSIDGPAEFAKQQPGWGVFAGEIRQLTPMVSPIAQTQCVYWVRSTQWSREVTPEEVGPVYDVGDRLIESAGKTVGKVPFLLFDEEESALVDLGRSKVNIATPHHHEWVDRVLHSERVLKPGDTVHICGKLSITPSDDGKYQYTIKPKVTTFNRADITKHLEYSAAGTYWLGCIFCLLGALTAVFVKLAS